MPTDQQSTGKARSPPRTAAGSNARGDMFHCQPELRKFILALSAATILAASPAVLPGTVSAQPVIEVTGLRPPADDAPPIVINDAVAVTGFGDMKPGAKGRLEIGQQGLRLANGKSEAWIPIQAVRFFALDHTTRALLRGVAGTLASLAPNGAGQIYSAIRPGAEYLTIFYSDENNALHGVVLLLPRSPREDVLRALTASGLESGDKTGLAGIADRAPDTDGANSRTAILTHRRDPRPDAVIAMPLANDLLPPAFAAASYESLIIQTRKSGLFGQVWRQGDVRADSNALRLGLDVTEYKKGNAGVRGAIPVAGMIAGKTLIRASLRLHDADGKIVFEQEVKGSKRMMGESIAASMSLAQRAVKALTKAPGLAKGSPLPDEQIAQFALNGSQSR